MKYHYQIDIKLPNGSYDVTSIGINRKFHERDAVNIVEPRVESHGDGTYVVTTGDGKYKFEVIARDGKVFCLAPEDSIY